MIGGGDGMDSVLGACDFGYRWAVGSVGNWERLEAMAGDDGGER
jgi:hypothetical protein